MNNILIPRNLDSREEQRKQIDLKRIQEYIKNGSQGTLDLTETPLTKLPDNLTKVGEDLYIRGSYIEDLNNLEYVGGYLNAYGSKLKSLSPKLTRIGWSLSLTYCPVDDIDNIKYIGGFLCIEGTTISELPEGLKVEGALFCGNSSFAKRFPDESLFLEYIEKRNIEIRERIIY